MLSNLTFPSKLSSVLHWSHRQEHLCYPLPVTTAMDQIVRFPVKLDTPAQPEILQEHVCRLVNGVEVTSIVQVFTDKNYSISHNMPFPRSCLALFQSESKCKFFLMKISFHSYVK